MQAIDMQYLFSLLVNFYDKIILEYPRLVIVFFLVAIAWLGYHTKDIKLDASAETLVLEKDEDLSYSRFINSRYGVHGFLMMTYAPKDDLFSDKVLANLTRLRDELTQLPRISSVLSILDVPLLESPPVPIKELADNIQTLKSPTVDKKLAMIEFKESPLYQNLLVSPDLRTTALLINLQIDKVYFDLLTRRNHFREKQAAGPLSEIEVAEFKEVVR